MKQFTITVLCCIHGTESEYKVSFPSEEDLMNYFCGKKDKLIAVSDGWGDFREWSLRPFRLTQRAKPPYKPPMGQWYEDPPYDYRTDYNIFFESD